MRPSARTAAALTCAWTAFAPPAAAVEREHQVGIELGPSILVVKDKGSPDLGGSAGAHWTYGWTDAINLMAEGSWSLLALDEKVTGASTPRTRPAWGANLDVGLGYVFDVMRWVPYVGILGGGYLFGGGTIQGTKVLGGASFALGADYRLSRSFAAGVAFRQHLLTEPGTYPSFTQALARIEYTWGW
jgi:Outer membrane protein beta-barrel domain